MAVRLKKAGVRVLLECNSSTFLQHCSPASGFPFVTTPPTSIQSRPVVNRERGRGHTSPEPTMTGSRSSSISVRSGSKYIVNPCRYPPHLLHTRLSCAVTRCQPLSISRDLQPIQDFHKLPLVPHQQSRFPDSRVPPLLSCVSLLCERATHLPLPLSPPPHPPTRDQVLTVLSPTVNVPHMLDAVCTFSSPSSSLLLSSSPDKPPGDDRPTPAQMAFVLLKLREETPAFFDGHHSLDLYAADMVFENSLGHKSWTVQGSTAYSVLLTIWRLGVRACFARAQLDLLKISKDVEQGKIEARWRARGRPRAPWKAKERIIVEAFSTFQVGADGNIAIHKVDKVMPGGKEPNRVMSWLARVGVALIPSPLTPPLGSQEHHMTSCLIMPSTPRITS